MPKRPSPALAISIIALVFSMAGTGLASSYLITSTSQIKPSVLRKLRGATGPTGPAGPQGTFGTTTPQNITVVGATGPQGPAGGFDPANLHYIAEPVTRFDNGSPATSTVTCPTGQQVVSGGYLTAPGPGGVFVNLNANVVDNNGTWVVSNNAWTVQAWVSAGTVSEDFQAYAICAS